MQKARLLVLIAWSLMLPRCQAQQANEQLIQTVQDAIASGNMDRALTLLQPALQAHPDDAGLLNLRGVVHASRGETVEAKQDFARATTLQPQLMPAWQNLARACQMNADKDLASADCAQRAWKRVLQWQPKDVEAHRGMALVLEREGKYSESLQMMAAIPEQPQFLTTDLMIRCLDLSGLKRTGEAESTARRLAAQPDLGAGDLAAMRQAPAAVMVILAEAIDARHELDLAGLKQLAIAYESADRQSDARKTLERVAAQEPNNTANLLELARVAERQNDHEGALGYLGHARELAPDDAQIHFLFARVASEMELPLEARKSLAEALRLKPDNPEYNFDMGCIILTTRDAATAASYFQKFVNARPNDDKGHYALGVAEFTSGDYGKAKAEMKRVERDESVGGPADFFLGRMARLDGDLDAAKEYQTKAIQRMPRFAESHTEMARVLMMEGQLPQATEELKQALALDAKSFQANLQLLALYQKTHDERAAAQAELLKKLDEERSKRAELMLRSVEIRP